MAASLRMLLRLLLACCLALLLAQVILFSKIFIENYWNSDGYNIANGNPVGGDFIVFYLAAQSFSKDPANLYNYEHFASLQSEFYEQHKMSGGMLLYAYPPLVTYLFYLLPATTLLASYLSWSVITCVLYFGSLTLLLRTVAAKARHIFFITLGTFGYHTFSISCLAAGQTSALGTALSTIVFILLKNNYHFLAGMVLSLSYYKPPLFLGCVLAMLFSFKKELIKGFSFGAVLLIVTTILCFGYQNTLAYIDSAKNYRYGQTIILDQKLPTEKGVGILSAIETFEIFDSTFLQIQIILILGILSFSLARKWKSLEDLKLSPSDREDSLYLRFYISLLSISLLFSIQMLAYDLSILYPFMIAFGYDLIRRRDISKSAISFYLLFILIFFEIYYRNILIGNYTIKLTTIIWLGLTSIFYLKFNESFKQKTSVYLNAAAPLTGA